MNNVDSRSHDGFVRPNTRPWLAACLAAGMAGLASVGAAEEQAKPAADWWLVRPAQIEPRVAGWAKKFPRLVSVESRKTLDGHTAYAISVTDRNSDHAAKTKILVAQPHAHEPAATAGMMDFLSQLIEGKHLDGRPTELARDALLRRAVLTFIPAGNPDGNARAPEDWWDGKKYTIDAYLNVAFGHEQDGRRCPRVGRFSVAQHRPARIGIVYERVNDHEYVEPNRDLESTYFKLVRQVLAKRDYALMVDLHQTEFTGSEHNTMVILPFMQDDLPEPIQATNRRAAQAVIEAWRKAGANPIADARPLSYGEDQIRYFRKCWGDIYPNTPCINIEVQNNNVRTPPKTQMELIEIAIRASIAAMFPK